MKTPLPPTDDFPEAQPGTDVPVHTLEIPLRLFRSTIRRVQQTMAGLTPGEVVRVLTNDP